jgi:hypothetical protein
MVRVGGYDYLGSLPHAVLLLLIALVLLWLLWKLATLPFRAWLRHRRKQGRARLIDGLNALQAGQWARAEKLLVAAADDDEAGPLPVPRPCAAPTRAATTPWPKPTCKRWRPARLCRPPCCAPNARWSMAGRKKP